MATTFQKSINSIWNCFLNARSPHCPAKRKRWIGWLRTSVRVWQLHVANKRFNSNDLSQIQVLRKKDVTYLAQDVSPGKAANNAGVLLQPDGTHAEVTWRA